MTLRIGFIVGLTTLMLYGSAHADYADRPDVRTYIGALVAEHGFDEAALLELFHDTERQQSVLDAIARPAERTLKWHEYRDIFLKEPRISQGLEFWNSNAETLARAEAKYGVPAEYIVAIIGVETRYGRILGNYRVVDSLTTLAFDYPPRSDFFRKELTQYLLLAREEKMDPLVLKGSYAGAMGYGQFIPSSFRAYAVDFDGDGVRDIWANQVDAIGSVANYFARHGWRSQAPVVVQVAVTGTEADALANESLSLDYTVGQLRAAGVQIDDLAAEEKAALFRMEIEDGREYWLGLNNFYVITRYNRSRLYALAVHQLGQEIRSGWEARQDALVSSHRTFD
ncbi:MAG: lytic murein transglycosylase B [Pseudomonadales bacterium]|nr:lytic murein transglycosylase B [Pseudomonadales bacterium]